MKAIARTELRSFVVTPKGRRWQSFALHRDLALGIRSRPHSLPDWRLHASLEFEAEAQGEEAEFQDDDFYDVEDEDEVDDEDTDEDDDLFGDDQQELEGSEFEERVIDLRRVTKVVKGGRRLNFRAVLVVGNGEGTVGVGNATAKEIPDACRKAALKAKRNLVTFPLNKYTRSFPNFQEVKFGAAKVMLRPAKEGTGVIAGGSMRVVLEVAGVRNGYAKILNSTNHMNIAKATVKALSMMRTIKEVVELRGVTMDYLLGKSVDPKDSAYPPKEMEQTSDSKDDSRTDEDDDKAKESDDSDN